MSSSELAGRWAGRRVLVTGATGMVGSWLCRWLDEVGAHVVALVRGPEPKSEFYRSGLADRCAIVWGKVEDYATVERAIVEHEVDTVLHLAAQTIVGTALRSPLATFEANVRGTYALLEACRQHAGLVERVAVASSDKAYGDHGGAEYAETDALAPRFPYDVSKACADLIAQSYGHTYRLPVAVARCGNIYGGGDLNWSRLIPGTVRALLSGQRPVLRSDGKATRDYLFVQDAVDAYLVLADRSGEDAVRGEAFNFSPGEAVSALDVVEQVAAAVDRHDLPPVVENSARNEIPHQRLCSEKAHAVLGWTPRYDLRTGLRETVDWYRAFFDRAEARW